jgi:RNA polymerase sigma-70 factor (ECF subfamily)
MDQEILEALYRRHYSAALLYCLTLCGEEQLAQDLVSDAFVKAYLSLPDDTPSFQYWLLRVCKNLWFDHLRRQKFLASAEPLDQLLDPVTPETAYIREQERKALWKAIGSLPSQDRELVTLHYFSALPLTEIAPLLGKSYAATRKQLDRLRQMLKQRMEEQGYGR